MSDKETDVLYGSKKAVRMFREQMGELEESHVLMEGAEGETGGSYTRLMSVEAEYLIEQLSAGKLKAFQKPASKPKNALMIATVRKGTIYILQI